MTRYCCRTEVPDSRASSAHRRSPTREFIRVGYGSNKKYSEACTQKSRSAFRPPRALLIWLLILGAPSNHAGRKPMLIRRANRHGCRFSRAGPWMALRGGPAESMSDYGYAEPKRGTEWWGKSVLLTFALSKVRRRKGATITSRYRCNGYVHNITSHRIQPHRGQASLQHLQGLPQCPPPAAGPALAVNGGLASHTNRISPMNTHPIR